MLDYTPGFMVSKRVKLSLLAIYESIAGTDGVRGELYLMFAEMEAIWTVASQGELTGAARVVLRVNWPCI